MKSCLFWLGMFSIIGCSNTTEPTDKKTVTVLVDPSKQVKEKELIEAKKEISNPVLPFTLNYSVRPFPTKPALPGLQAYSAVMVQGKILVIGGRTQGLHGFNPPPAQNMPQSMANKNLVVIDPSTGEQWSFDTTPLPANLRDPLQANNAQSWYDRESDQWYIVGGYGWDSGKNDMVTFNTILRVSAKSLIAAIVTPAPQQADVISKLFEIDSDDRFAITGGGLHKIGSNFYLALGQQFTGEYRVFDPGTPQADVSYVQKYSSEIRVFTLKPKSLDILSFATLTSSDPSKPLHRRDGPTLGTVNPANGNPRIVAFGGVFKPGSTQGYREPIYIDDNSNQPSFTVDSNLEQKFSQYECPVIPIYDSKQKTVYSVFFGGISHYFYQQTDMQKKVYDLVTSQKRADGVPFVGDVSVIQQKADGTYDQFILPKSLPMVPIPQEVIDSYFAKFPQYKVTTTNLMGSSVDFIFNSSAIDNGTIAENGVVNLDKIDAGKTITLGYIYGSIVSVFPYALIPSQGTFPGNLVIEVTLTSTPGEVLPGSAGTAAKPTGGSVR